jgi:hypothetical protein
MSPHYCEFERLLIKGVRDAATAEPYCLAGRRLFCRWPSLVRILGSRKGKARGAPWDEDSLVERVITSAEEVHLAQNTGREAAPQ